MKKISISNLLFGNIDSLFYWGCLLITFTSFPLHKYGLGGDKSLSLLPFLGYIIIVSLQRKKLYLNKTGKKLIGLTLIMLIVSCTMCIFKYSFFQGFNMALGTWGGFIINIGSFMTFMYNADRRKVYNMLRCLFLSFWFSFIFCLVEVLYFITDIQLLRTLLLPFLRDDVFLSVKHLQLNFCEAGDAGQLIPCLFILIIWSLKRMDHPFSICQKGMVLFILFSMLLFSGSASFVIVCLLIILLFVDVYMDKYKLYRIIKPLFLIFIIGSGSIIISTVYESMADWNGPMGRVAALIYNPEVAFDSDLSSACRIGMWFVSTEIFFNNFIFGTGLGNFGLLFPNYINNIPIFLQVPEIMLKAHDPLQMSYSIFSTMLAEGGLLGIIWLCYFIKPLFAGIKNMRPFALVFLVIAMQQMVVFSSAFIMIWLLLTEPKVQNIFKNE